MLPSARCCSRIRTHLHACAPNCMRRRARLKKDLKDGRVQIDQILSNPPEYVSTAKVFDMLMAVPKFGRVKAARFLNMCRISQSKTVGGLSDRQRSELIGLFHR